MPCIVLSEVASVLVPRGRARRGHEVVHFPRDGDPRQSRGEACGEHRDGARVLRDGPARNAAREGAEELYARIDSRGRARRSARRGARYRRGELCLKNVEPGEKDDERGENSHEARERDAKDEERGADECDGREEHRALQPRGTAKEGGKRDEEACADRAEEGPRMLCG